MAVGEHNTTTDMLRVHSEPGRGIEEPYPYVFDIRPRPPMFYSFDNYIIVGEILHSVEC